MKGISAVIATIMMLVITIALAGVAYLYISGLLTQQTARGVAIVDTSCNSTFDIQFYVQNTGTQSYTADKVNIALGSNSVACGTSATTLTAGGGTVLCPNTIKGVAGFNSIIITGSAGGPTNVAKGSVAC